MVVFVFNCLIRSGLVSLLLSFCVMGDMFNATVLGAGSSVLGSALGMAGAKLSANLQQKNWEKQFNMINEYNSPRSQLARLYDAGINPLYNSEFSGNSAASISASAPGITPNSPHFVEDYQRMRQARFDQDMEGMSKDYQYWLNEQAKAEAKKKGSDAEYAPTFNQQQFEETNARIKTLLAKSDLDQTEKKSLERDMERQDQYLLLKMRELNFQMTQFKFSMVKANWEKRQLDYSNETDRINAQSNAMNARTNRLSYNLDRDKFEELDKKKFEFEKDIQNKMVENRANELFLQAKEMDMKQFQAIIDQRKRKYAALFGLASWDKIDENAINSAMVDLRAYERALENGSSYTFEKRAVIEQEANDLYDAIERRIKVDMSKSTFGVHYNKNYSGIPFMERFNQGNNSWWKTANYGSQYQ